eukprot:gnl/Chilomastix_cuspidata/2118.p1 GENE.gnl/Chilomastix_cuspidata/2118~~gnl/Chilomastix_cuspidata/2118.p1  ORF type:complete len:1000 (-),score=413.86 gnl/Chilomastix_cuspidata/2118:1523-4522(-)
MKPSGSSGRAPRTFPKPASLGRSGARGRRNFRRNEKQVVEKVNLNQQQITYLIGKRGCIVEAMKKKSGAKISYRRVDKGSLWIGTVIGSREQVSTALALINGAVASLPHSQFDRGDRAKSSNHLPLAQGIARFLSGVSGASFLQEAKNRFGISVFVSAKDGAMTISGFGDGLDKGTAFLKKQLSSLASVTVPVPGWSVGRIIGRKGEGLNRITTTKVSYGAPGDAAEIQQNNVAVYFPDTSLKLASTVIAGEKTAVAVAHDKVIQTLSSVVEQAGVMLFLLAPPQGTRVCLKPIPRDSIHGSVLLARQGRVAPESPVRTGGAETPAEKRDLRTSALLSTLFPAEEAPFPNSASLPTSIPHSIGPSSRAITAPVSPKIDGALNDQLPFEDLRQRLQSISYAPGPSSPQGAPQSRLAQQGDSPSEATTYKVVKTFLANASTPLYSPLPSRPASPTRGRPLAEKSSPGSLASRDGTPLVAAALPYSIGYCVDTDEAAPREHPENVTFFSDTDDLAPPTPGSALANVLYGRSSSLTVDRRFAVAVTPTEETGASHGFVARILFHSLAALSAQFGYAKSPAHRAAPFAETREGMFSLLADLGPLSVSVFPGKISLTPKGGPNGAREDGLGEPAALYEALRSRKVTARFLMGIGAEEANRLTSDPEFFRSSIVTPEYTDEYFLWRASVSVPVGTLSTSARMREQVARALPAGRPMFGAPDSSGEYPEEHAAQNPLWNSVLAERPVSVPVRPVQASDLTFLRAVEGPDAARAILSPKQLSLCLYLPSQADGYDLLAVVRPAGPAAHAPPANKGRGGHGGGLPNVLDKFVDEFVRIPPACSYATTRGLGDDSSGLSVGALPAPNPEHNRLKTQLSGLTAKQTPENVSAIPKTKSSFVPDSDHAALVQVNSRVLKLPWRGASANPRVAISTSELVDFDEFGRDVSPRVKKQIQFTRPGGFALDGPEGTGRAPLPQAIPAITDEASLDFAAREVSELLTDAQRVAELFL